MVSLLTVAHGRHAGLVRGAFGRRGRGHYEVGNGVTARWRARLPEHLGHYACELTEARAATLLDDALRLAALASACALAQAALPERQPYPAVHAGLTAFLDALGRGERWQEALVQWELLLLAELGYGLDLTACAATGATDDLIYVSPRSGRALSRDAGAPYKDKLLPLPAFLHSPVPADRASVLAGLALTGWFLEAHVFREHGGQLPAARDRFIGRLSR